MINFDSLSFRETYWKDAIKNMDGVVFVIDASDQLRFHFALQLAREWASSELKKTCCLFYTLIT